MIFYFPFLFFPSFPIIYFAISHIMRTLTLFPEFKISTFLRDNIKTKSKRGFQFSIWVAVAVKNEFTHSELVAKLLPHGNQAVCLTLIHFLGQD